MSIDDTIFEVGAEIEKLDAGTQRNWEDLMSYINSMETSHDVLLRENRILKNAIEIVGQVPNSLINNNLRTPGATNVPEHHRPPGEPDLGDG